MTRAECCQEAPELYVGLSQEWFLDFVEALPCEDGQQIYVAEAAGRYKIGTSASLLARLRQLGTYSPFSVELVNNFPGGIALERTLHRLFDDERVNGEWFELSSVSLDFLEVLGASLRRRALFRRVDASNAGHRNFLAEVAASREASA